MSAMTEICPLYCKKKSKTQKYPLQYLKKYGIINKIWYLKGMNYYGNLTCSAFFTYISLIFVYERIELYDYSRRPQSRNGRL